MTHPLVIDHAACPSLPAMLLNQAAVLGDRPLLWAKRDGAWTSLSWRETADATLSLAGGLLELGLEPGDRVLLVSENRPEFAIADLAVMAAGGITVPAYTTNTAIDHQHVLNHCRPRIAIVSTRALADKLLNAALSADHPPIIVAMEPLHLAQFSASPVLTWADVLAMGKDARVKVLDIVRATMRTNTACIIYTSGTGGAPKGVMLSHGAILSNCQGAYLVLQHLDLGDEVFLSFLPLSHCYEHTAGLYFPMSIGAQIYYAEGIDQLAGNMAEVRPTVMTAVPRLYETMRLRMLKAMERQKPMANRLMRWTLGLGRRKLAQGRLPLWLKPVDLILDRLVRDKVRARFGGRLKAMVSGGAPLALEVGEFFTALGVCILQGYGQTEAAPVISCNLPGKIDLATVGPPMEGVEVRIANDGEICVRGELVMQGYWNDAEATRAVIDSEGWLHTGDIGELDQHGNIRITDRKRDIIVNSGGDNIAPQRAEGLLTLEPEIAQAMVHGDRRPHMVALIVPAEDWVIRWAHDHGHPSELAHLATEPSFRRAVAVAIERVNQRLSPIEKIRRFAVAPTPFTVENGMLTATLKIRRHKIREVYGSVLNGLYDDRRSPTPT